ncbi:Protein N-acetyltransferase, RimJ/RimL family [Cohaesibacter sp. ES.047]|uniref:GNAT family N-acetyltransferase n=1 Tax=Cohaesibacter sp. ES.047 TaxID=1798205 RepID=UPI000BB8C51D|nr:GNAT family N-acetyltransferase [Cohaesibacter sp. ES.047]SNY90689.1 Protein N-acetyltransferase, RimJ/RimL family [Cohaesibacter sp. ES.047]
MPDIEKGIQETEPDCRTGSESNFILRRPTRQDLEALVVMASDPHMVANLCTNWLPSTMRAADLWLDALLQESNPDAFPFVISDMKGRAMGAACIVLLETPGNAEISVLVEHKHWSQGIATRSMQALADFAFSNPTKTHSKLDSMTARCRVSCGRSRRIVEKSGFQFCGSGMAHSHFQRGMIPIDRYRLDRSTWHALRHWAGVSLLEATANKNKEDPSDLDVKGAA